ncbi:TetR/AcrR family transcriptional regulator [Kordiimonas lipolytica]|uniref:TetR/AcrR family transcriptional regulator n=1 Tax=Kordiimonas lipolytica TaxID=1662421 RepID=A0ABV8UCZ7_9PROT|nr:TetR/AcrR family transcriptional regulator [Kordiimonas lipolytica]
MSNAIAEKPESKRKKTAQNRSKHEAALIHAAAVLFRKQGYAATGTAEILKRSGAPRGSLYYYFPEGKEAIGAAALEAASKVATRTFRELAGSAESPADFVQAYAALLSQWMEKSGFTDGCPVATTVLETVPTSDIITPVAKASFGHWQQAITDMLLSHDWPRARVRATATLILSAFEGALISARVERSSRPILDAADELSILLKV